MKRALLVVSLLIVISLGINGVAYSMWCDSVYLAGQVTTMRGGACINIQKTFDGAYTDPTTGADLLHRTNQILIGSRSITAQVGEGIACPPPPTPHPTKFLMYINVTNCGSTELTNVVVTDRLENQFSPLNTTIFPLGKGTYQWTNVTHGGSGFNHSYLVWSVGTLAPGEKASIVIWITTVKNPAGIWEPTSACTCYPVNLGAKAEANSAFGELMAQTDGIILRIDGYISGNIARITTPMPNSTNWAVDNAP
jgi:hypothetical protein